MKDKNRIINELVMNTTEIMEAKVEELQCIASQFDAKGDSDRAAHWRRDVPRILDAIAVMRENAGCWA